MGKRKGSSKQGKLNYNLYASDMRSHTNRTARLEKHCKNFPEDKQAKSSLKKGLADYRRYAPRNKIWTATNRYFAQLFVKAGMNGNDALPKKEFSKT